jgi:signal transduction histidine kinase
VTRFLTRPPGSLRRRLVVGVTVLATAAVLASQVIGYVVLRTWLLDRVDEQLVEFHPPAPAFYDALDGRLPVPEQRPDVLPSDFHIYFYDASGRLLKDSLGSERLDVAETVGDPHRLRQILENLLSNARTHTPPGTRVHVRVGGTVVGPGADGADRPGRTSASPPLPERLPIGVIEVADEGPGLEPVDAELVFERFYRADPARSRLHGGSGLGLAIAATIAEGHGGRLELDTAPRSRLHLPRGPARGRLRPGIHLIGSGRTPHDRGGDHDGTSSMARGHRPGSGTEPGAVRRP